jgi:hypothetical protein
MRPERSHSIARILGAQATRRHALHGVGASSLALALGLTGQAARAGQATPAAASPVAGSGLDALDTETKDNIAQALWLPEWDEMAIPAEIRETLASEKNSPRAYGERIAARLQALIDEPETFTPDHAPRYEALLQHCEALSPH